MSQPRSLTPTRGHCSGGERTRTADFYVANVALYQLSYTPVETFRIAPVSDLAFHPTQGPFPPVPSWQGARIPD